MTGERNPADLCAECGATIEMHIVPLCRDCVARRIQRCQLEQEREAWEKQLPKDLALSYGVGKLAHLVMTTDTAKTFCGKRATQPKKNRIRAPLDDLPARCCTDCRGAMEHTRMTAAPRGAAGGGQT